MSSAGTMTEAPMHGPSSLVASGFPGSLHGDLGFMESLMLTKLHVTRPRLITALIPPETESSVSQSVLPWPAQVREFA